MAKDRGIIVNDDVLISVQRDSVGTILSGIEIGDTLVQNQQMLLITERGELKHDPLVGVGAASYILDDDQDALIADICTQFRTDGMTVTSVTSDSGVVKIKAEYGGRSFR